MKVKVFPGTSPQEMEAKVQQWLDITPGVIIQNVVQSQDATGWVTLTLFYFVKPNR